MPKTIETVGERIKRCREELKLTQAGLGKAAGVSASAVSQWESGDTKSLKPTHLFKIARALKKDPEWLITGEGPEQPRYEFAEAVEDMPNDSGQATLDFMEFQWEKAEGLIASDKIARYTAMIDAFRKDLESRKRRDRGGSGRGK